MRILLLEDDDILSEIIEEYLTESGHEVMCYFHGEKALDAAVSSTFDMLLIDVNVPGIDGFDMLRYLRDVGRTVPALFITSRDSAKDVKRGFEAGADDYLKKPFELEELGVRIAHIARQRHIEEEYRCDGVRFVPREHRLEVEGNVYVLTQKESKLLHYFMRHPGRVIGCEELIENIWHDARPPTQATIRTYIKNLRKCLPGGMIENIKGEGYRFNVV